MAGAVYVDPERLADFAAALKSFARRTDRDAGLLIEELGRLSRTWQDESYEEFQAHVRKLTEVLLSFVEEADGFSVHLNVKADQARQIHRGEMPS